ncbi:MAG: glycosyltransferase family 2 protein [Acidobacteriota bacterium]
MRGDYLVSAVMPTANRPRLVRAAIACFQAQTYAPRELVILDDGESVENLIPNDDKIRYFHFTPTRVLGEKHNLGCELSRGEIICHWDDDDWSAPGRMEQQVAALLASGKSVTGYHSLIFLDEVQLRAWDYHGPHDWVLGCSLCYLKSYWAEDRFPRISAGYDSYMILQARKRAQLSSLPGPDQLVARRHSRNTSPFLLCAKYYREIGLDALPPLFVRRPAIRS